MASLERTVCTWSLLPRASHSERWPCAHSDAELSRCIRGGLQRGRQAEWIGARPTAPAMRHRAGIRRVTARKDALHHNRRCFERRCIGRACNNQHRRAAGIPLDAQRRPPRNVTLRKPLGPVPRSVRRAPDPDLISTICCAWETQRDDGASTSAALGTYRHPTTRRTKRINVTALFGAPSTSHRTSRFTGPC